MSIYTELDNLKTKKNEIQQKEKLINHLIYEYNNVEQAHNNRVATIPVRSFDISEAIKFYNEDYYLATNLDVVQGIKENKYSSGFQHFCLRGHLESRNPSPYFDAEYYLKNNPDVLEAINNKIYTSSAFHHYILIGNEKGVKANPYFHEKYFLEKNQDVKAAVANGYFSSGAEYFNRYGAQEYWRNTDKLILFIDENKKVKVINDFDFDYISPQDRETHQRIVDSILNVAGEYTTDKFTANSLVVLDMGLRFISGARNKLKQGETELKSYVESAVNVAVDKVLEIGSSTMLGSMTYTMALFFGAIYPLAFAIGVVTLVGSSMVASDTFAKDEVIQNFKKVLSEKILSTPELYDKWKAANPISTPKEDFIGLQEFQKALDQKSGHAKDYDTIYKENFFINAINKEKGEYFTLINEHNGIVNVINHLNNKAFFEAWMRGHTYHALNVDNYVGQTYTIDQLNYPNIERLGNANMNNIDLSKFNYPATSVSTSVLFKPKLPHINLPEVVCAGSVTNDGYCIYGVE